MSEPQRFAEYGGLTLAEQVQFFRAKKLVPSERWADVWRDAHDRGFMIAGAVKTDMLEQMQTALTKAIEKGTTLAEFRRDFDGIVKKHGWAYKGGRGGRRGGCGGGGGAR